jgi:hypothetical protein
VSALAPLIPVKFRTIFLSVLASAAGFTGGRLSDDPAVLPAIPPPLLEPGELVLSLDHLESFAAGHARKGRSEGRDEVLRYLELLPPDLTPEEVTRQVIEAFGVKP